MSGSPRALVFLPYGNWGVNFATSLELAQRYLDDGWDVTLLRCAGTLPACDTKHHGASAIACWTCRSQQRRARGLLGNRVDEIVLDDGDARVARVMATMPDRFEDVAALRALRYENLELGEAVYSSIASAWWMNTTDPDFDAAAVQRAIRDQIEACVAVHAGTLDALHATGAAEGVAFNGRMAIMRAFIRACESAGADYWTHDRGADRTRLLRVRNGIRHEMRFIHADIERVCASLPAAEREAVAASFYADRRGGVSHAWRSFTGAQKSGYVPIPEGTPVLAAFTSTATEFVGLGPEWDPTLYPTQAAGLAQIADSLARSGWGGVLAIRVHPNTTSPGAIAEFAAIGRRHPFVRVYAPEAEVDTYALIDRADRVLVFGSTTGMEAAYAGAMVILAGPATYRGLGSAHEPATHDALMALLLGERAPLPREGAIAYGCWLRTFGESFRYAGEPELGFGTFRGRSVDAAPLRALRRGRELGRAIAARSGRR